MATVTPLKTAPVELNIDEAQIILGMGNFVRAFFEGSQKDAEFAVRQYNAAGARLGPEGVDALSEKLNAHADSLGGFNKEGV